MMDAKDEFRIKDYSRSIKIVTIAIIIVGVTLILSFILLLLQALGQDIPGNNYQGISNFSQPTNQTNPTISGVNNTNQTPTHPIIGGGSGGGGGGDGGGNSGGNPPPASCTPSTEICDGIDNDCNGFIDENIICQNYNLTSSSFSVSFLRSNDGIFINKIIHPQNGIVEFEQKPLFQLNMRKDENNKLELLPANFSSEEVFIFGNSIEIKWSVQSVIQGNIEAAVKISIINGEAIFNFSVNNTDLEYSLFSADFPRLAVKPIGDPIKNILYRPFYTGALEFQPTNIPQLTGQHPGFAFSMQYLSLYNLDESKQFYFQTTDSLGYRKDYFMEGLGTATLVYLKNYPENNVIPGNDYTMPYGAKTTVINGNWYDAAKYYRSWALQQPWASLGRIETRTDISPVLKNAKITFVLGTQDLQFNNFDIYVTEMNKIKNYLGLQANEMISVWYNWHNNIFDMNLPDHLPPRSTVISALASAQSEGHFVLPYINVGPWAYQSQSYINNNVDNLVVRDENNNVFLFNPGGQPQQHAALDLSVQQSRNLITGIISNIFSSVQFNGIYWDLWAGPPPLLDYSATHGHPLGGGSYWTQGKRQLGDEVLSIVRENGQDRIFASESFDETLIDKMELIFRRYDYNNQIMIPAWETVYHDYVLTRGAFITPPITSQSLMFSKVILNHHANLGQILEVTNWFTDMQTLLSQPPTPEEKEYFDFLKLFFKPELKKYRIFGERLRPPPVSFESFYEQQIFTGISLPGAENSVWKASDGDIGIIMSNADTNVSLTVPLQIDYDKYGLSGIYNLYENINGTRYLVLGDISNDFTINILIPANSVNLYELVPVLAPLPSPAPEEPEFNYTIIISVIVVLIIILIILIIVLIRLRKNRRLTK